MPITSYKIKGRCRLHGGASGSAGPPGERNGQTDPEGELGPSDSAGTLVAQMSSAAATTPRRGEKQSSCAVWNFSP